MKKLLFGGFVFAFGFLFAVLLIGVPLSVRAGAGASSTQNGDVNGDGMIDIADAVYTLLYLFKGGEPPVACADTPALVGRVEALEDTNTRIANALEELTHPCRERPDRFVDNGDGTVTDTCTGLMWQQKTALDVNGDGTAGATAWARARQNCEDLALGGHDDWRLPTARELESLVISRAYGPDNLPSVPSCDPVFGIVEYSDAGSGIYWTSTVDQLRPDYAFAITFISTSETAVANPRFRAHRFVSKTAEHCFVLAVRSP
jgi:hypothetical protein